MNASPARTFDLKNLGIRVATALVFAILSSHYELTFGPAARVWAGWVLMALGAGGSAASFLWGALSKRHGYYRVVLLTRSSPSRCSSGWPTPARPSPASWWRFPSPSSRRARSTRCPSPIRKPRAG